LRSILGHIFNSSRLFCFVTKKKWICFCSLLLVANTCFGYYRHYVPPLFPLPVFNQVSVSSDSTCVTIPFTRAGNLILIRAKVDTTEGNFVLDTGAPGLVLNITYFREYAVNTATGDQGGITGAVADVARARVRQLSFNGVTYHHIDADVINLGHIESAKGVRILGLLGMELFGRFEMVIDYKQNVLRLHLMAGKESPAGACGLLSDTSAYATVPIDVIENKIIAHVSIGSKKLLFVVDYGAETNVLDSRLSDKVLDHVTVSRRILLSGSGDKKVEALYGTVNDMSIGSQHVQSVPILITNLEKMCFSYNYCIDGMLGFDYLSLHKVGFNFMKRKMYIWK